MSTVLLIEDDTTFREWTRDILLAKFPGMEVLEAAEGEEAMRNIWRSRPDVVILDIGLPGKNGIAVAREIREKYPRQEVMFLTNYSEPEFQKAAEDMGIDHFLDKSTTPGGGIVSCVASLLNDGK